jgi:cob(I)alamin adenosyltransferase
MTIYTRTGDAGDTALADGTRCSKASPRVEAYGAVDEANSAIGLARAATSDESIDSLLQFVQHRLFNCSANLARPGTSPFVPTPTVSAADVAFLESAIDRLGKIGGGLSGFSLEAGNDAAGRAHLARAIVRRAERRTVALAAYEPVDHQVLAFLNRLSDLLFAIAHYVNAIEGVAEEPWDPHARPPAL